MNRFQHWVLRKTEPWREERASLDLEWRIFAQKHNAAGKRPMCWYPGMELDPMEKVEMLDLDEPPIDPDYLRNVLSKDAKLELKRKQVKWEEDRGIAGMGKVRRP